MATLKIGLLGVTVSLLFFPQLIVDLELIALCFETPNFPCEQYSTSVTCCRCHCSRQHCCEQMPLQVHSPVASGRSVTRHHLLPPILPLTSIRCARQRLQKKVDHGGGHRRRHARLRQQPLGKINWPLRHSLRRKSQFFCFTTMFRR